MHQSLPRPTGPVSTVSNPSWKAIAIAWIAFIIGPVGVMFLISNPGIGAGFAIGVGLSFLVQKVGETIHHSDTSGVSTRASRMITDGGAHRESPASESD